MKKLMIAVAAVAMVGAAFADGNCAPGQEAGYSALAYQVKMSVRTTRGIVIDTYASAASWCDPGEKDITVVRAPTYTVYSGWIWDCTPVCDTIAQGNLVLWDSVRQVQVTDAAFGTDDFIHVIGTTQSEAEWFWTIEGTQSYSAKQNQTVAFQGAGFGYFNGRLYTAFSGYLSGTMSGPYALGQAIKRAANEVSICDPAGYWDCTKGLTLADLELEDETIAYGAWVIQYSAVASQMLVTKGIGEAGFMKAAFPKYVKYTAK